MQGGSHVGGAEASNDQNSARAVPHGSSPSAVQGKDSWLQDAPKDPQGANLSNLAVASTIPKAGSEETWHYPSPQRFYNAMRRKGFDPEAKDVPYVVSIHNTINEKCWAGVMEYEQFHEKCDSIVYFDVFAASDVSGRAVLMT
jgi:cytochrome c heme-lyase